MLNDRLSGWELVQTFLAAKFTGAERFRLRLAKVTELEKTLTQKTP
jgi:ribose 5-phosphate isomerase RpiB